MQSLDQPGGNVGSEGEDLAQACSACRPSIVDENAQGSDATEAMNLPAEQSRDDLDVESFLRDGVEVLWNQKMLGSIPDQYAPQALIHVGAEEILHGSQQLLECAVQCLAAFPDLRVFIDDVIYVERPAAYVTSVRWTAVGRNTGPSVFGAATGRRVVVTGICNSRIERGRYVEQWIELGDGDLGRQLGFNERSALQRLWPNAAEDEFDETFNQGTMKRPAQGGPEGRSIEISAQSTVGMLISTCVDTIWNRRQIGEVERFFASHYRERGPGSRTLFGRDELQTDIVSLMGAFPDLQMYIDDVFWDGDQRGGCQSSMRWTLLGTNSGPSVYGPPTNTSLRLSGITNHRIEDGQIVEGWTAYSELSLARRLAPTAPRMQSEEAQ
jgi:predicted ester cyclase